MIDISIIIPVYNSERYILDCLKSVLATSFENMECIIINDGSTDNTLKTIEKYIADDNRVRVYSTANRGVAMARNLGIKQSKGKYIFFLDSDDYLTANAWQLIQNAITLNKDIYIFNYSEKRGKTPKLAIPIINNNLYYTEIIAELSVYNSYLNSSCGKLFKKEIIEKNTLTFPDSVKFGEDACFVMEYLCYVKSIYVDNKMIFTYRMHSTNTINNFSLTRLEDYDRENKYRKILANHLALENYIPKLTELNAKTFILFCVSIIENCNFKKFNSIRKEIISSNYYREIVIEKHNITFVYRIFFISLMWNNSIICFLALKILRCLKYMKKFFV